MRREWSKLTSVKLWEQHGLKMKTQYWLTYRVITTWTLFITALVVLPGCNCQKESPSEQAGATAPPAITTRGEGERESANAQTMTARMRVVNLQGQPLPGMVPIATLQPNAFDQPIATGVLTSAAGESHIRFTTDQKVALRAWDPELRYFPNNFYEIMPNTGEISETLLISMVKSASLEAVLFLPDGRPAMNENVGLMLFHAAHGPWWPAEADADEKGAITFSQVPPGQYVLRVKVASGAAVEIPETYIAPGQSTHLGLLYLQ